MMTPKHKQRLIFAIVGLSALAVAIGLILYALSQNINLFFTPSDIASHNINNQKPFRLGGMVVKDSLTREKNLQVQFRVTDFDHEVSVSYQGILPDLFREGQGIVALGQVNDSGVFVAKQILAKHDENYMPPEAAKALEKNSIKI